MINIKDKRNCSGCSACVQSCHKGCISLCVDSEGFTYPTVDIDACNGCGVCEAVCPIINPYVSREPNALYAAININDEVRQASSSGGVFSLLAQQIIQRNGVVFGARFDEHWQVMIDAAETLQDIERFLGSKYVQARVGNSYKQCKVFLQSGREVLFSGTPCQISGLLHYLRKPYTNLLTCDFICHGVPSPEVWRRYLKGIAESVPHAINFRDKKDGWKNFAIEMNGNDGQIILHSSFAKDLYMRSFLNNVTLRPSCYTCAAKCGRSGSDITLADFWGIGRVNATMDDDKGTSLVIVNTLKGAKSLPLSRTKYIQVSKEDAFRSNPAFYISAKIHPRRAYFFENLDEEKNIIALMEKTLRPNLRERFAQCKHPLRFLRLVLRHGVQSLKNHQMGGKMIPQKTLKEDCKLYVSNCTFRNKQHG